MSALALAVIFAKLIIPVLALVWLHDTLEGIRRSALDNRQIKERRGG